MKINGSLVFDASSASQIENLRLEKFGSVPAAPAVGDNGRLIFVTGTGIIYVAVAGVWVPLATGGDASALLAEVDAMEAALGLSSDGTWNAGAYTGNLAGSTSLTNLIGTIQGLIATNASGLAAEIARATAAEQAVADDLADEVTRATAAETALQGDIDDEVTRATAAEAALQAALDAEVTARTNGDTTNANAITAEATARANADTALGTRIDNEEDAREAGDATNAAAIEAEETRAIAAEDELDGRITQEVSDRTAAVNTVATNLAAEISARTAADTAQSTALTNEINRATAEEAAIRGELASALAGLSWEAPVVNMVLDHTTLNGLPAGARVVNLTTNTIYTADGNDGWDAGEALVDGAAFFNSTNDTGYVFNGTAVVPFSGAASFVAGAGLSMSGNTVNVGNTDGSITVTADNIAVSAAVRTEITDNAAAIAAEETRATTAEAGLDDRIDDEIAARVAAVTAEATARAAADTALQAAIDAEEAAREAADTAAGAALDAEIAAREAADTAEAAARAAADTTLQTNITNEATARAAADTALGGRIDDVEADLATEVSDRTAADTALTNRINKMYFLYDNGSGAEAASATTHVVTHNLGQSYCNVTVVANNEVVIPQSITFNTPNQLTVTFNTAIPCRVVVMGLAAV